MKEQNLKLILIRHAETVANSKGEYLGFSDSPLTEEGKISAKSLCEYISKEKINHIYASTSNRVHTTIRHIKNLDQKISLVDELREINFGKYEGRDFKWIETNNKDQINLMIKEGSSYKYPEGESLDMMYQRVSLWLDDFLTHNKEGTYLIAAHGGVIRSMLSHLLTHTNDLHWNFKIKHASITILNLQDGFPVIENLGYVPYNDLGSNFDIK